jgi:hypothetical protein
MSVQCPVRPKADKAGRFMSTGPRLSLSPRLSCPTSSARTSRVGGTVSPNALAVVPRAEFTRTQCFPRRPPYPPLETQETPPHQIVPHNPLDSCNENLPEKSIHRKYASRPGGRPRRVFCCAHAAKTPSRACEDGDANCRLQQQAAIVSRLFFTMKIPTLTCGGGDDLPRAIPRHGCGGSKWSGK